MLKVKSKTLTRKPLWDGPEADTQNGGITFSLLSRFLVCRERFRITVVDGVKPNRQFSNRVEYGNMWHVCEEALAKATMPIGGADSWQVKLSNYSLMLMKEYPTARDQIMHWTSVCRVQFPLYVNYWSKHPDVLARTTLVQEQVFNVPYKLPSGRTVRLRGKWDSMDLIGKGKEAGIYVMENKTKGDIKPDQMKRQLSFDLQTQLYLIALNECRRQYNTGEGQDWIRPMDHNLLMHPVKGVRYNVVRRPLSGGKGNIKKHQPTKSNPAGETDAQFYARLGGLIAYEPDTYFMRWKCEITSGDVDAFRRQCLDPILEQLCDWWEWIGHSLGDPFLPSPGPDNEDENMRLGLPYGLHWRHPFGCYNVLDEGGASDLDEYLLSGSTAGLRKVDNLFPELV